MSDVLSLGIQKANLAFTYLHHLSWSNGINLSTNSRIYAATVLSVLFYGSEIWPLKADVRWLLIFDHRDLHHRRHRIIIIINETHTEVCQSCLTTMLVIFVFTLYHFIFRGFTLRF